MKPKNNIDIELVTAANFAFSLNEQERKLFSTLNYQENPVTGKVRLKTYGISLLESLDIKLNEALEKIGVGNMSGYGFANLQTPPRSAEDRKLIRNFFQRALNYTKNYLPNAGKLADFENAFPEKSDAFYTWIKEQKLTLEKIAGNGVAGIINPQSDLIITPSHSDDKSIYALGNNGDVSRIIEALYEFGVTGNTKKPKITIIDGSIKVSGELTYALHQLLRAAQLRNEVETAKESNLTEDKPEKTLWQRYLLARERLHDWLDPQMDNITAYQKAFLAVENDGLSQPLVIGNLNRWFIGARISIDINNITIHNLGEWIDFDGYEVLPELNHALSRGLNGCGIVEPQKDDAVSINPQQQNICYELDNAESAKAFAAFLRFLQQTLKKQDEQRKNVKRTPSNVSVI